MPFSVTKSNPIHLYIFIYIQIYLENRHYEYISLFSSDTYTCQFINTCAHLHRPNMSLYHANDP